MFCLFVLGLIAVAPQCMVYAQNAQEEVVHGPSGQTFGPLPSFPAPRGSSSSPGPSGESISPGVGVPALVRNPSPFGPAYPPDLSSELSGVSVAPEMLPGTPIAGTPIRPSPGPSPETTAAASYSPSFSYPGLSGMSGSTGLFGPAPGSMGTGTIASTTPGSMLASQAGVYGYPAGVPGSPAGAGSSRTLGG